jgi:hypothetical protein
LGRFGGIVAVDADRTVRELLNSHPPKWMFGSGLISNRQARTNFEDFQKHLGLASGCPLRAAGEAGDGDPLLVSENLAIEQDF